MNLRRNCWKNNEITCVCNVPVIARFTVFQVTYNKLESFFNQYLLMMMMTTTTTLTMMMMIMLLLLLMIPMIVKVKDPSNKNNAGYSCLLAKEAEEDKLKCIGSTGRS